MDIGWFALYTRIHQEERAEENLRRQGLETFLPRLRSTRRERVLVPLFPRYMFARFCAAYSLCRVSNTRGVRKVVTFGGIAATVDDTLIELIRSHADADGIVDASRNLSPGDRVIVREGPLRDLAGIFQREVRETDRVRILLDTMRWGAVVELERSYVAKASAA